MMLGFLALVAGLGFTVPAGETTDLPPMYCAQVEKADRTYVVCTEAKLDDDEVEEIVKLAEAVRRGLEAGKRKAKELPGKGL